MYAQKHIYSIQLKFFVYISTGRKKSRRGKLVQMTALKPRGADGGLKRTPPHLGDAWQKQASYDVEEVSIDVAVFFWVVVDIHPFHV